MASWTFRVVQDGQTVASAWGTDRDRVAAEARHYAMVYGQDGPVKVFCGRRRVRELEPALSPLRTDETRDRREVGR